MTTTPSLPPSTPPRWLHRFACTVVVVTGILIYAGGFVTTIGAGLAVPDWPTSFGEFNPDGWWRQPDVRAEHGHRLIGATVGLLTLIQTIFLLRFEQRRWVRMLGVIALVAVIVQGVLGGLRVIEKAIGFAMVHACLAQAFLCLLLAIAYATSQAWQQTTVDHQQNRSGRYIAVITTAAIFGQLVLGVVTRHSGAGLAIITFPLVDGGLVPKAWGAGVAIHYAHRIGAVGVVILVSWLCFHALSHFELHARRAAIAAATLTGLQIALGASIIWTQRAAIVTTAHVLCGALVLAAVFSCALWTTRRTQLIAPSETIQSID